jgi:hypothetical protein
MANNLSWQILSAQPPVPAAGLDDWHFTVGWWNTDSDPFKDPPDFTIVYGIEAPDEAAARNELTDQMQQEKAELEAGDDPNPFGGDDDSDGDSNDDSDDDTDENDDGNDDGNEADGTLEEDLPPKEPK